MLAIGCQHGHISPRAIACHCLRLEGTGFGGPSHLPVLRFNRTSDINALGELPSTIEITSTWNGSYLNATDCLSFSSFYRYLHTCRRHLRQGLLVAFLASGGGMYRLQLPQAATKGCFLSSG